METRHSAAQFADSRDGKVQTMLALGFAVLCLGAQPGGVTPPPISIPGVVLTLTEQANVPAREAGVLLQISAREGQTIEAGQALGQIDDADARLRPSKAESELLQATQTAENDIKVRFAGKSAEVAKAELQRALDAVGKFDRSVSQSELDRLQLLADKSVLEIEQAALDLTAAAQARDIKQRDQELAAFAVARRRIIAPLTGMVVQWYCQPGEWVEPGSPVVRVIRLNKLRAEGFAPATQLSPQLVGSKVTLLIDLPDHSQAKFPGELAFVSPEIDSVNGQVRFWAEIENPQLKLRPGQLGSLSIPISTPRTGN